MPCQTYVALRKMSAPQLTVPSPSRAAQCPHNAKHTAPTAKPGHEGPKGHHGQGHQKGQQGPKSSSSKGRAPLPPPPTPAPRSGTHSHSHSQSREAAKAKEASLRDLCPREPCPHDPCSHDLCPPHDLSTRRRHSAPHGHRLTDRRLSSEDRKRIAKVAAQKLFASKSQSKSCGGHQRALVPAQQGGGGSSSSAKAARPPVPPGPCTAGREASRDFLTLACYNAVGTGQLGLLKALYRTGRVPLVDKQGNTPLHVAAKCGQLACLR